MDSDPNGGDDLDVSLQWPDQGGTDAERPHRTDRRGRRKGEPDQAAAEDDHPASDPELAVQLAAGSIPEDAQVPLAAIAIRLEGLSAATTMMRVAVSDRLTDLNDQMSRALATSARDMEDYRRLHDRAVMEVRERLGDLEMTIKRVSADSGAIAQTLASHRDAILERLEELSGSSLEQEEGVGAHLTEQLEAMRDGLAELRAALPDGFQRLTQVLETVSDDQKRVTEAAARTATTQQTLVEQIGQQVEVLDALRTEQGQAGSVVQQVAAEQRSLLEHLVQRLDVLEAPSTEQPANDWAQRVAAEQLALLEHLGQRLDALEAPSPAQPANDWAERVAAEQLALLEHLGQRLDALEAPSTEQPANEWAERLVAEQRDLLDEIRGRFAGLEGRTVEAGPVGPADNQAVLERLDKLTTQVDALRRRIALRARTEPYLDVAALDSLADSIAQRLAEGPPAETPRAKRRRASPP